MTVIIAGAVPEKPPDATSAPAFTVLIFTPDFSATSIIFLTPLIIVLTPTSSAAAAPPTVLESPIGMLPPSLVTLA
ncbi:hypothetical protein bhYOR_001389 (plasmid) [Borrelia nietonii YOR]|nr:hypothetical protein bhYOR_001389 [Borrelia nietonii YOR]